MCDKQTIREFIAKHSGQDPEYLEDDLPLTELVIDSFDVVNLIIAIQQEMDIHFQQQDLVGLHTLGDLIGLAQQRFAEAELL